MILGFDHLVLGTQDLAATMAEMKGLGLPAGERPDVRKPGELVSNAFVGFPDGSYIQIFSLNRPATAEDHRWAPHIAQGGGWIDHSLWVDAVEEPAARLKEAGIAFQGPRKGKGELTDGTSWQIEVLQPEGHEPPDFPFMVKDVSERSLRVPASVTDAGGRKLGIVGTSLAVADPERLAAAMKHVFGDGLSVGRGEAGSTILHMGGRWIEIVGTVDGAIRHGILDVTIGEIGKVRPGMGRQVSIASAGGASLRG